MANVPYGDMGYSDSFEKVSGPTPLINIGADAGLTVQQRVGSMTDDMEKLLDLLGKIERREIVVTYTIEDYTFPLTEDQEDAGRKPKTIKRKYVLQEEVAGLACGLLIGSGTNGVNWANVKKMQEKSYTVSAAERDSFGWLIGQIHVHLCADAEHERGEEVFITFG